MNNIRKHLPLFLLLSVHLILLIVTAFTAWPEMLAWPYFISNGLLPYRDIAIAHTPLLIFDLSLVYKLFGAGPIQIQIYAWMLTLLTDLIIYFVTSKLYDKKTALCAVLIFISLHILYEGNGLWFDYAITPLILLSFYYAKREKYLTSGLFWGLAFLTKQTAFWFLPAFLFMFWGKQILFKVKEFSCGLLIPITILFVSFQFLGILPNFLYWAFQFGILTLPRATGQINFPQLKQAVVALLPFAMLFPVILPKYRNYLILGIFAVLGILGAYPRWELFHFQPGLPFLAMFSGLVLSNKIKLAKNLKLLFLLPLIILFLSTTKIIIQSYFKEDRFLEKEVLNVAKYVEDNTKPGDKIFVLNTWDSIYALSDRMPSTVPWVPQLEWMYEMPNVKKSVMGDLNSYPPVLVIMQPYTEIGLSSYKPKEVTDLIFRYYTVDKVIDNAFWVLVKYK